MPATPLRKITRKIVVMQTAKSCSVAYDTNTFCRGKSFRILVSLMC